MRRELIVIAATLIVFFSFTSNVAAETLNVGITADTYVEQKFPSVSPWNNKNIYIGYDTYYDKGVTRAFITPDSSPLAVKEILPNDIVKAELMIYQYESEGLSPYVINAYTVGTYWSEYNLNWDNQPDTGPLIARSTFDNSIGWKSIDITKYLKDGLTQGITLRQETETLPAQIYWSIACQFAPTPPTCSSGQQPYVRIEYKPNLPPTTPVLTSPKDFFHTNYSEASFEASACTDPEGESLKYQLEISTSENFDNFEFKSEWSSDPRFSYNFSTENLYFWRIKAQDQHGPKTGQSISETRRFIYDVTPPTTPQIEPEPPFTSGTENTIHWDASSDPFGGARYIAQSSLSEDFSSVIQSIDTGSTLESTFVELKDSHTYFYRVQAYDLAGNYSGFSEVVSSIQDANPPQIESFTANPPVISPWNKTSIGKKDQTNLKIQVADPTLESWTLKITDQDHKLITATQGSTEEATLNWPDPTSERLKDGKYFAYIEAQDRFQRTRHSDALSITIDDTSPRKPVFSTPQEGSYINSNEIYVSINAERYTRNLICLNNTQVKEIGEYGPFYFPLNITREGTNILSATSIDEAENQSSSSVSFTLDTRPPDAPTIELIPDPESRAIYVKIKGEKESSASIYANGQIQRHHNMESEDEKVLVITNWRNNYTYSIFARLTDKAQNTSTDSNTATYTTPPEKEIGTGGVWDKPIEFPEIPKKGSCKIKVHKDRKTYKIEECSIPEPKISHIENQSDINPTVYWFDIYGSVQNEIKLKITHYKCKDPSLLDPRTWFTCVDQKYKTSEKNINLQTDFKPKGDDKLEVFVYRPHIDSKRHFVLEVYSWENPENKKAYTKALQYGSTKISGVWVDLSLKSKYSNKLKVPESTNPYSTGRYFSFVFDRYIGVTQWHGYTAYQSPHPGIDFGSVRESIKSPADGYVRSVGWDSYYGPCSSGGYYARIEHDNDMHTTYFHLESYVAENGHVWTPGDRIIRGQQVGISGNSGAWNCQPLGYHLHFELRKNRYQSSHVDPVPYINVDWNQIPTLNWQTYPGRLSGDNPHPNF